MAAGQLYDYIIAVVATGVIVISSITAVTNFNFGKMLYNDEQQLIQVAMNILNTLLLDPGDPHDWGLRYSVDEENVRVFLNESEIRRFGLAQSGSSTTYVLDPNKVSWLVGDTPYGEGLQLISYERVRDLLGLQGYGFSIRIISPLVVSVSGLEEKLNDALNGESTDISFSVSVKRYSDLSSVPNAKVTVTILYSKKERDTFLTYPIQASNFTDKFGECHISGLTVEAPISFIVAILQVNAANLSSVSTFYAGAPPGYAAGINILQEYLILTHPKKIGNPNEARFIQNICLLKKSGKLVVVYNSTGSNDILNWGSLDNWVRLVEGLSDNDVSLIIVTISAHPPEPPGAGGRRQGVLVVGPYPACFGSRVISYGGVMQQSASVKVSRIVEIGGMLYIFELTVWKEL